MIYIALCICIVLAHEVSWPNEVERQCLLGLNSHLPGSIKIIDGILVKIESHGNNPNHAKWFIGRNKMYCRNNTFVVSHEGLFIHLDLRFPVPFMMLQSSAISISIDIGMHTSLMMTISLNFCLEILAILVYMFIYTVTWQCGEATSYGWWSTYGIQQDACWLPCESWRGHRWVEK